VSGVGRRYQTVSFLSDLGTVDEGVGVVRSVLREMAPHVAIIDLTHDIAPFDVRAGSLALARAIQYVASGVVLAVVDPAVGTDRRAIAIEVADGEGVLVGPDNGLLAPAVAMAGGAGRSVVLSNTTFRPFRHETSLLRSRRISATALTLRNWVRWSTPSRCCPASCPCHVSMVTTLSPR
jgi:S-adenosylmethionine hydrolase